jgi:hypothetical protein
MSKMFFLFGLLLAAAWPVAALCADDGEKSEKSTVREAVKGAVSGIISSGKEVLSGVTEGIEEGRKSGSSTDGAKIVSNAKEVAATVALAIAKQEQSGDGGVQITLAIRNDNDFPVRLTRLGELGSVVLLDQDGFTYPLADPRTQGGDVTALAKSSTRVRYVFSGVEGSPSALRLYGADIPVRR